VAAARTGIDAATLSDQCSHRAYQYPRRSGAVLSQFRDFGGSALKSNKSRTGILSLSDIFSSTSNDGEFRPRSIKLRKSTEIPNNSANSSCVS
jgi:hypothetical protein